MATMNVSLPEEMKRWVEDQTHTGRYGNASYYIRDLIRKDQDKKSMTELQALITQGMESGISERTTDEIIAEAKRRIAERQQA